MKFLAWTMRSLPLNCPTASRFAGRWLLLAGLVLHGQSCQSASRRPLEGKPEGADPVETKTRPKPHGAAKSQHANRHVEFSYRASGCRISKIRGQASSDTGASLSRGAVLSTERWLSLKEEARVTVKFQRGGREVTLAGFGKFLPCAGGEETVLLGAGRVQVHAGSGGRAGAEALVATAFGSLKYGDAQMEITVDAEGLTVSVESGSGVWLEGEVVHLQSGAKLRREASRRASLADALDRCKVVSQQAHAAAVAVLSQGREGLGVRAKKHVDLRRRARIACGEAGAVALSQSDSVAQKASLDALSGWRQTAMAVPSTGR